MAKTNKKYRKRSKKYNKNKICRCRTHSKNKKYKKNTRRRKYGIKGGEKISKEEIKQFSNLYGEDRLNKLLSTICGSETKGSCLDFTKYKRYIDSYFENYSLNTPYVRALRRIGNESLNGAILEFQYIRNNYISHSALKFNRRNKADNLLYEYYVGTKFINYYTGVFPCFIETYKQLYMIDDLNKLQTLQNVPNNYMPMTDDIKKCLREIKNPENLINSLNKFINNACMYGKKNAISIMLQHFGNFTSLSDAIKNSSVDLDFPNLMLQVYFPLATMKDIYTHYDLHRNNVYLFKPYVGNRYIEFTYHYNDGKIITFPSEYVVKIIDYGRNYFNNKKLGISSKDIIENVCLRCDDEKCENPACYSSTIVTNNKTGVPHNLMKVSYCGEESGMYIGEYNKPPGIASYISPNIKNISHDLRLLYGNTTLDSGITIPVFDLLSVIDVGMHLSYDGNYGTRENLNSGYNSGGTIRNLNDIYDALKDKLEYFINSHFSEWKNKTSGNGKYGSSWVKMGELHIYEDMREYEFIESVKINMPAPTSQTQQQQSYTVPFLQDVMLSSNPPVNPQPVNSQPANPPTNLPIINQTWSDSSGTPLNRQLANKTPQPINYGNMDFNSNLANIA